MMSANESGPSFGAESIVKMLDGTMLSEYEAERTQLQGSITDAQGVLQQLKQGTSEEVVKVLTDILSKGPSAIKELPRLQQYIDAAMPQHVHAPLLRAALQVDIPVWIHGEAGSGKSTSAQLAATALGLGFRSISLGPTTSKSDLVGYRDATGQYHDTGYRRAYEDGGVFLFDEIDNAHPSILTLLNSSIANGHGEFPDSRVQRAEDTRFVATANTIGRGATAEYVGRAPIDAATIDRFAFIEMDIDPALEESIVLGERGAQQDIDISEGEVPSDREWLAEVRAYRDAAAELGIRAIISQRAAIYGVKLAQVGVGKKWLKDMLVYKGMNEHDREKLTHAARPKVRRVVDTHGELLAVHDQGSAERHKVSEPSADDVLRIDTSSLDNRLKEFINTSHSSMDIDSDAYKDVTTLAWHLNKSEGLALSHGSVSGMYYTSRNNGTIKEVIQSLKHNNKLSSSKRTSELLHTDILHYMQERGIHSSLTNTQQKVAALRDEFSTTYGFDPDAITLMYWLDHRDEESDAQA